MENEPNTLREPRQLLVIGAGGAASNIVNVAFALDYQIFGFIHDGKSGETLFGKPIFGDLGEVDAVNQFACCIALGDNYQRQKYVAEARSRFPKLTFPTLIHPTSTIGPYAEIGIGTVVMPHSVIGTNVTVGAFCLLGNQSCVGHDSYLSDFSSIGPAATLAGNTLVGRRSAVGLGAKVREKVRIGDDSILGSCSFLNSDLRSNVVAFGIPARIQRDRQIGDEYLR